MAVGLDPFSDINDLLARLSLDRFGADRPVHSRDALQKLYKKAESYVAIHGHNLRQCRKLYRDKSDVYFMDIQTNHGQIMKKYKKDFHGDPKSPINGVLEGLFFTANVDKTSSTDRPPIRSIYGSRRFLIDPERILSKCPNMYFTDFYCVRKNTHYVTMVLTKTGSAADRFCRDHLLEVDVRANPFFRRTTYSWEIGEFRVTDGLWVEILVTEDIDIATELENGAEMSYTIMTGKRSGGSTGLRKNALCGYCNI